MDHVTDDLGTRILNAARLAVAMHLNQVTQPGNARRQVVIGGAGPHFVTDDTPRATVDRAARDETHAARRTEGRG